MGALGFSRTPTVCIVAHQNFADLSPQSRRKHWRSAAAVFLIAAGGTFSVVSLRTSLPGWMRTIARPSELGLRVDRTPGGLLVHWDHRSRPVWNASGGTLNIHDGPYSRTVSLDAEQVASGSVLYEQQTGDVTFELNVHSRSGSIAEENLRVVGPATLAADFHPALAAAPPDVEAKEAHVARRTRSFGPALWMNSIHGADTRIPATAPFAEAPTLVQQTGNSLGLADLISTDYDMPRQAPPFGTPAPLASYIPPRIIRQVKPDLRLLGLPSSPIAVQVQVDIDESGQVVRTSLEHSTGKASGELTKAALEAARKWMFEPAVLHGKKIPSGQTILFEFEPGRGGQ